jgi:hypothetical protein
MTAAHAALAVAGLLAFAPVQACGVCNEDKVAATYDHAVVRRANLQGRVMVFCEARGALDSRWLKAAASRIDGIDAASLRTSTNPATVSFALDGRRQSPQAAVNALQAMAPRGTELVIVQVQGSRAATSR